MLLTRARQHVRVELVYIPRDHWPLPSQSSLAVANNSLDLISTRLNTT